MREIKFRGWNEEDKEWIYGAYWNDSSIDDSFIIPFGRESTGVNYKTVGQFTGLHDKNGVEVYENDVIELIDRLVVVKWNEYLCAFDIEFLKFKENKDSNFVFNGVKMHELNQFEVIGNVHEENENNDK